MPRTISLNAHRAIDGEHSSDVPVVLVTITHPDEPTPIRLSTDPTERLSLDPLVYGTRSDGEEYKFALMAATLPDDSDSEPPRTAISFEIVDAGMVPLMRSSQKRATVDLRQVMASDPDTIQVAYEGLKTSGGNYDQTQMSLFVTGEVYTAEPFPRHKMAKAYAPGLFPQ